MTWKFQTIRTAQVKAADAGNQELHDGTSVDRYCYYLPFCSGYCLRRETFKSWFCWLYSCDKDLQSPDFQALASFPKFFNANPVSKVEPWIFVPEHQIHTTIHKRHTQRHTNPKHDPWSDDPIMGSISIPFLVKHIRREDWDCYITSSVNHHIIHTA